MKNSTLLMVAFCLIFANVSLGDDQAREENFSEYVNSSGGPVKALVNSNINPVQVSDLKARKDEGSPGPRSVVQEIPYQWKMCAVDADCTAVANDCVSWESINKKYLKKLSRSLNFCSASIDPGFQPVSVCVDKACNITGQTTNVSWEEWLSQMHRLASRQK